MGWRFRLDLEYDGTGFSGWQVQPGLRTVQGEIERLLGLLGERVRPTGAGRTDAGVHALGNAAHADLERDWDSAELGRALAALAPGDIHVRAARRVDAGFHARFDAVERTYVYAFARAEDAFFRSRRWPLRSFPDPGRAGREMAALEGERDFAPFVRSGSESRTTRCRLVRTGWEVREGGALLTLTADRFLYGMVRSVAGTLVDGLRRNREEGFMARVLEDGGRAPGAAAPAAGLYLAEVLYPGEVSSDRRDRVARLAGLGGR